MPKLTATDLGDIGARSTSKGDPDGIGDPIQYRHFQDRGCFVHPSCFSCPLPTCHYDDPKAYHRWRQEQLENKILTAVRAGLSVADTAQQFGRTESNVYRILRDRRHRRKGPRE